MNNKKINVHTTKSDKKGFRGFIETAIRKFRQLAVVVIIIPIAISYVACLAISLTPCVYLLIKIWERTPSDSPFFLALSLSFGLGLCFIIFTVSLLLVVPLFNFLLVTPFGGVKPIRVIGHSFETIPWYYHNAMVQLPRFLVLDFLTPTPFIVFFYKLMGMKIGKNVVINSTNISDPCLITLEDHVVIGGSATIFAHYGMHGFLIVSQTIIKKGATIGLRANIMGDVIVGENQTVPPGVTLLPKTRLPDIQRK